ncbi:MAG: hypothetical protein AB1744_14935, partial [Candidatus Zixiibacteriota bacterium]
MNKTILIASAQEDFAFPLAEAARKQILALAERLAERNYRTEVLIATPAVDDDFTHGHVRIRLVPRRRLNSQGDYFSRFSQVFYFGTIGVAALKIALLARNT